MLRIFILLLILLSTAAFANPSHFKCWSARQLPYVETVFQQDKNVNIIVGSLRLKIVRLTSIELITYRKVELDQIDETGWLGSFDDGAFTIRWLEDEMFKGHLSYMDGFSVLEFNLNCQNILE